MKGKDDNGSEVVKDCDGYIFVVIDVLCSEKNWKK